MSVYSEPWYKDEVAKAERQNRSHVAKYERSFNAIMAKANADGDARERDDDNDIGKLAGHPASTVADLLVESGRFPHRTAALDHLLNSPHGNALLARLHKAEAHTGKESQPMTSHTELVRDVVKQFGVVALAKSMVQDQKSYGLDEPTFTQLATEHAQRLYPNDRPDVAFSKLYQGEESVRRACAVLKAAPWVEPIRADVQPVMVGGVDATHEAINSTESSEAYRQLQELGQQRWANERSDVQFARAFEANPELARKAHVRPSATTSYEFPR